MLTTSQVKSCTTVLHLMKKKKKEVQEWIACPNSWSCLGVSLGFGLVLIFGNNFLSSLCYLLGKNLLFQGGKKWKKKRGKKEERNGGREEGGRQNPHCRLQRQTREQNLGDSPSGSPTMSLRSSPQALALPSIKSTPLECRRWPGFQPMFSTCPTHTLTDTVPIPLIWEEPSLSSPPSCHVEPWSREKLLSPCNITKCYPWRKSSGDHGKTFKMRGFGCSTSPTLQR